MCIESTTQSKQMSPTCCCRGGMVDEHYVNIIDLMMVCPKGKMTIVLEMGINCFPLRVSRVIAYLRYKQLCDKVILLKLFEKVSLGEQGVQLLNIYLHF